MTSKLDIQFDSNVFEFPKTYQYPPISNQPFDLKTSLKAKIKLIFLQYPPACKSLFQCLVANLPANLSINWLDILIRFSNSQCKNQQKLKTNKSTIRPARQPHSGKVSSKRGYNILTKITTACISRIYSKAQY